MAGPQSVSPALSADLGLMSGGGTSLGNCDEIALSCANGRNYPLCPIAVNVTGEIVTASLFTSRRGATKVRLIPMGVGYRYAGIGVWFEGLREQAQINFGKRNPIACSVVRS